MDITLTAFPEEELAAIAKWRSDDEVHKYLRHGYTTTLVGATAADQDGCGILRETRVMGTLLHEREERR